MNSLFGLPPCPTPYCPVVTADRRHGEEMIDRDSYLKLFPEALLDLVRGLGQFAQLPHSTLDLRSVNTSSVQRLRGGGGERGNKRTVSQDGRFR